jgi:tRNA threonylcarbamoyladenosine biosynthesis protein TsaE
VDEEEVTSPSFTLVNLHHGRLLLYHLDLYRLAEGAAAAHAVDLDEILSDETAVAVIEWGERLARYPLPAGIWRIGISGDGDEPRKITISGTDFSL